MATATLTGPLFSRMVDPADYATVQRARMLEAITRAVAAKGYASVTVSDVVAGAGVSRRTFYEHFREREDCFLAAFSAAAEVVREEIARAIRELDEPGWREVLRVALETYLRALATEPEVARVLKIDIFGAGPAAVDRGREVGERFVELLRVLNQMATDDDEEIGEVPDLMLRAVVGGISQLVEWHLLSHGAETLGELADPMTELVTAVIEGARTGGWASALG